MLGAPFFKKYDEWINTACMREREQKVPRNDQIHIVGCAGMVGLVSLNPRKREMKWGKLESIETWGEELEAEAMGGIVNAGGMSHEALN